MAESKRFSNNDTNDTKSSLSGDKEAYASRVDSKTSSPTNRVRNESSYADDDEDGEESNMRSLSKSKTVTSLSIASEDKYANDTPPSSSSPLRNPSSSSTTTTALPTSPVKINNNSSINKLASPGKTSPSKFESKLSYLHDDESSINDCKISEEKIEDEVDAEFEALKLKPNVGTTMINTLDPLAQKVAKGFRINSINMRDGSTGRLIWESRHWGDDMFEVEQQESIPKEILQCRTVSREINFSSRISMNQFRLEQRVYFRGQCIEEWGFKFGFVMPGSTNGWQQVIEAAPAEKMLHSEDLSGNVTFETSFFDGNMFICKNLFRIFYI